MRGVTIGALLAAMATVTGCGTVDPGTGSAPPQLLLDEDTFYCEIQPAIINAHDCARSGCHGTTVALDLAPSPPADCVDGRLQSPAPGVAISNFEEVRLYVQSDPSSSPFYRAPVGEDGHELIFGEGSDEAAAIAAWIVDGTGL